jgi:hypothetical protein
MNRKKTSQRYSSKDLYSSSKRKSNNGLLNFFKMKRGKVTLVVLSAIFLLVGTMLIGVNYYLSKINYTPIDSFKLASTEVGDEKNADPNAPTNNFPDKIQFGTGDILSNPNIQNVLLIGSDTRGDEEYGRSDSMMIMSINKTTKQVKGRAPARSRRKRFPRPRAKVARSSSQVPSSATPT